jgi:hypothetical protein
MNNRNNYLKFYHFEGNSIKSEEAEIKLEYLNKNYSIEVFVSKEIRDDIDRTKEFIELVNRAKKEKGVVYDFSTGNCCWMVIDDNGVNIECEYVNEISENIKLDDMKIILEKWLDFLEKKTTVEYSWS